MPFFGMEVEASSFGAECESPLNEGEGSMAWVYLAMEKPGARWVDGSSEGTWTSPGPRPFVSQNSKLRRPKELKEPMVLWPSYCQARNRSILLASDSGPLDPRWKQSRRRTPPSGWRAH